MNKSYNEIANRLIKQLESTPGHRMELHCDFGKIEKNIRRLPWVLGILFISMRFMFYWLGTNRETTLSLSAIFIFVALFTYIMMKLDTNKQTMRLKPNPNTVFDDKGIFHHPWYDKKSRMTSRSTRFTGIE